MYFEKPGSQNTSKTIELAIQAAKENGIKDIVLATSTGATVDYFKDLGDIHLTCITYAYGFHEDGMNDMSEVKRAELSGKGYSVYTAAHVLAGAERAFNNKFGGMTPVETVAYTLRFFGQGVKVCVEIATMAADGGMIKPGVPIVAVGGTGRGADTAVIMRAAHANRLFDTKIDQIICKPIV